MNTYESFLKKRGVSLNTPGNSDVALKQDDALSAVELLKKEFAMVLGGDVYFLEDGAAVPAYANWYCNKESDESASAYSQRSCEAAIQYIKNFPSSHRNTIFVLVTQSG